MTADPAPTFASRPVALPRNLAMLEAEAIHIFREAVAEASRPVLLYSIGKDSSVLLHLALKAFAPAPLPFPCLHVASGWDFAEMLAHRDRMAATHGLDLKVVADDSAAARGISPFTTPVAAYTRALLTEPLKAALSAGGHDAIFGGGRRDEERARAKERICSFRNAAHAWEPRAQRPELWSLWNLRLGEGESVRVFPLSNWTEADIWHYIHLEAIPLVPLYFAAERPVVERGGQLIVVDDPARFPLRPGEAPVLRQVRFRTLGCWPLSGAVPSIARSVPAILAEMRHSRTSERQGRLVDGEADASMEAKKREGYF